MGITEEFFPCLQPMREGDLELRVLELSPPDRERGHAPAYRFSMKLDGVARPVGGIDLRLGNTPDLLLYGGQIGFGVRPPFRGRHLAARSVRLLLPLALRHRFPELWITCNPANLASRRSCELAGGTLVEIVDIPEGHSLRAQGELQKCRYRFSLEP